jgi:hypothetical protein
MHLCGPALTTTGKKKGKFKFRNAEEAQRARELDADWKDLLKRQGVEQEARRRRRAMSAEPLVYKLETPVGRTNTKHIPSLNSGLGVATLAPAKVYTGDKVLGISQMAKSNAVPVFNSDHIVEIARMRR